MIDLNEAGDGMEQTAPVWAVFGDLMSSLLGAFVLILVGVLVVQMDLVASLESEVAKRRVEEMLMVSGFTDNEPIWEGNRRFGDNLELSAQRALTVTRALIEEGMPSARVFAAAFGAEQPVAANTDEPGRTKNRRVEMAPVARSTPAKLAP